MGGLTGAGDVVERSTLMEERRLRRVEILGRSVLLQRAAAEGDDAAAPVGDREHDAIAEAIVWNRDVLTGDEKAGLDHVLDWHPGGAEMFLQRILPCGRIAEPKSQLRWRGKPAVGEIAATARAVSRRQRSLEKLGGKLDDVMERLTAFLARFSLGRIGRQRDAGHLRQPFDRFRKADALGFHYEIENAAVLSRREVVIEALFVVDRERGRLFLVERRQSLPLAAGLAQFHAPADDRRNRKPRAQLIEKLRRKFHGDSPGPARVAQQRPQYRGAACAGQAMLACPGYPQGVKRPG